MRSISYLYDNGLTYDAYINSAEEGKKEKHLSLLGQMKLNENEKDLVRLISQEVKMLVFCDVVCDDCRIVLAVLENMCDENHHIQYRITSREDNRDIMLPFDTDCRIPLVIEITNDKYDGIFYELPMIIKEKMQYMKSSEKEEERKRFRYGGYKEEIIHEIVTRILDKD